MIFLIFSIVIINGLCFLLPRRLTWGEIIVTAWFGLYFEAIVNIYLDVKFDLYGYYTKGVDWKSLLPILGLYPALNYLVLNFYPSKSSKWIVITYLLAWDFFSVVYEVLSIKFGFFYHNGWTNWLSALVYPFLFYVLWLHLKFYRWAIRKP